MSALYFDTAYVAKCYLNEIGADVVREAMRSADVVTTSSLCIAEFACAIQRNVREGVISLRAGLTVRDQFAEDASKGLWKLVPVSDRILWRVEKLTRHLSKSTPLRSGAAIHIATALEMGFPEIWTNDRHLLAAAGHFGLRGRTA